MYFDENRVQIICGCFEGNLKEFQTKVKEKHAKTEHLIPYLNQIRIMKYLIRNAKKIINEKDIH